MKQCDPNQMRPYSFSRVMRILGNAVLVLCFCLLLTLCIVYRDKITADEIVKLTPSNRPAAVLLILLLFAVKSFCIFIYCGILYAASGMIFSFPMAFAVNILGTVIMTSLPYMVGSKVGSKYVDRLMEKHKKMAVLKELHTGNGFFLSLMIRMAGLLPSDPVSAFFGANGMAYGKYIISTVLGFLPMITAFTVMGMSIHDVRSPAFIAAVCAQLGIMAISCVAYVVFHKRHKDKIKDQ